MTVTLARVGERFALTLLSDFGPIQQTTADLWAAAVGAPSVELERDGQVSEVLSWAEEAAQYASVVMIIPKVFGIIDRLPRRIAGADVRLGYSVPTKFGGTELPVWEFAGWPVHLLGGSPQAQMQLLHYLDVRSADGNMASKAATRFCNYWTLGGWRETGAMVDAPYEAFRRSCKNIAAAWDKVAPPHRTQS